MSNLSAERLFKDYSIFTNNLIRKNAGGPQTDGFQYCNFQFLLSAEAKKRILTCQAELQKSMAQEVCYSTAQITGEIKTLFFSMSFFLNILFNNCIYVCYSTA